MPLRHSVASDRNLIVVSGRAARQPGRELAHCRRHEEADCPEEKALPPGLPEVRGTEPSQRGALQEVQIVGPAAEEQVGRAQEVKVNIGSPDASAGPVV